MQTKPRPRQRGRVGRVTDVRFMEVEFAAPAATRMVIELEGGLRLLVADDAAVELAAQLINSLASGPRRRKGGTA